MTDDKNDRLERFVGEIMRLGYSGLLPCNLSDEWLDLMTKQATDMLEGREDGGGGTELVAAITILLQSKNPENPTVSFTCDEMYNHIQAYRMEMILERFHRQDNMIYNPATLATILTERKITVRGAMPPDMQAILERINAGPLN